MVLVIGFVFCAGGCPMPVQPRNASIALTVFPTVTPSTMSVLPALRTDGNRVVDPDGRTVRLRGVNIPSLLWTTDDEPVIEMVQRATAVWGAQVVRISLAQDRWFGKTPEQTDDGAAYRATVDGLVDAANRRGAYVILNLHWTNGGQWERDGGYLGQHCMPDRYSIDFWTSVSTHFAGWTGVILNVFNEPFEIPQKIWREGGEVTERLYTRPWAAGQGVDRDELRATCRYGRPQGEGWSSAGTLRYEAPGMQELYDAVRATGADQIVMIGGVDGAHNLSGALDYGSIDGFNIVYDVHVYPYDGSPLEWERSWGRVAHRVPVWVGEWGCDYGRRDAELACGAGPDQRFCPSPWARQLLARMDELDLSWMAWSFHPYSTPTLIRLVDGWTDYAPTESGRCALEPLGATDR
jgi:hypothetical protein